MADNKKYYYLKLVDNFFDRDEIIYLENEQDGDMYVNILLKLYLRSLKNEGKLMFKERIPYNAEMLAKICRKPVAVVEKAIYLFEQLGLLEKIETGAMFMNDIQEFIGKSSTEADRKRRYRNLIQSEKDKSGTFVPKLSGQKSTRDRDRDRDRDNNIETIDTTTNFIYPSIDKYVDFDKEISEDFMNIREPLVLWIREAREEVKKHFNSEFRDEDKVYLFSNLIQTFFTILRGKQTGSNIDNEIFNYALSNVDTLNPDNIGDMLRKMKASFRKAEMRGKKINSFNYIIECL